ncbi:uncharacterized protein C6orf118-like [Parambassis ranga]|uniref:Uncharacterized protein C6orf118-like n=1 Tax=Parambassis ranga TaxID=210632 RepID=A0A6P7JSM0_9TELE|nr:uncharacterized protein C6orf118 homolog [Parambassis ranga]
MSNSCKPKPGSFGSDIHRLLQAAEAGQKADILTYSSGHLGPRGLNYSQPFNETKPFFWSTSQSQEKAAKPLMIQKRQIKALPCIKRKELKESPSEFMSRAAFKDSGVSGSRVDPGADHSSHADSGKDNPLKKVNCSSLKAGSKKHFKSSSDPEGNQPCCSGQSDLGGLNNEAQPEMRQQFGQKAVTKQNLWAGINVAEMHERKLQKELKKLSAQSWPSRDRLAVFSDVFDDVCEGSPVFGRILREIKTDYDLYVNHLMASQASLQNTSLDGSIKDCGKLRELELAEAAEEVCSLEQEARRALEEKKRVQNELQNVPVITGPEDSDMKIPPSVLQGSCCDSIHFRRLQVLKVWKDIQQLEEEIKEKLVSTDTERRIKQQKTEIMKLIASNERLRNISKARQSDILCIIFKHAPCYE